MGSRGTAAGNLKLAVSNDGPRTAVHDAELSFGETKGGSRKTALSVENVSVTYRSARGKHTAVDRVSMNMQPGEFVSILGPSGCGKSTLLGVVAGLLDASDGDVSVFGESVKGPRVS